VDWTRYVSRMVICVYFIDEWVCVFWWIISLQWKTKPIKLKRILYIRGNTLSHRSGVQVYDMTSGCRTTDTCESQMGWLILITNECETISKDHRPWCPMVFSLQEKTVRVTIQLPVCRRIHLKWWFRRRPTVWNHRTPSGVCPLCPMNIHVHEIRH